MRIGLEEARADPDGFLADLTALVAGDRGGFATLGAAGVAFEAFNFIGLPPAALALIDAGIAVKQARDLPDSAFAMYEAVRLRELRDRS